jgi:hypothetical protein
MKVYQMLANELKKDVYVIRLFYKLIQIEANDLENALILKLKQGK